MPLRRFIVGRQAEVRQFDSLLAGRTSYRILNIYGPGGIGKTVVCDKLSSHARARESPVGFVDSSVPNLTADRVLHGFVQSLADGPSGAHMQKAFRDFEQQFHDYLIVNQILERSGGLPSLFDAMGNVKDPTGLTAFLAGLGHAVSDEVQRTVRNRFALERYLGNAERALTDVFLAGLRSATQATDQPVALLIDTYEDMEGLDPWVCSTLAAGLPTEVPLVILGRNQVHRINFDWHEFGDEAEATPLAELPEPDAKAYLQHYGLTDPVALDRIYQYTGGYPLLLVLVRQLANEAGGWQSIGTLEQTGDRDYLATQLLERILREERAREVRAFLERGAIAPWFNPEVIGVIMDLDPDQARELFDRLRHHSFVERHVYGLRLHDKIRQLLEDRLQATSQEEYRRLKDKLAEYHAAKAGWTLTSGPAAGTG